MQRLLTLAAAVLLVTGPTLAQAETSAAKKELVQKVITLQQPGLEAFARVVVEQPVGQMMQAAGRVLQQAPEADRANIGKAIEADARKYVDDVAPGVKDRAIKLAPTTISPLLEERLSDDELKVVIAWLESPVSRKYGQLQPEMQKALGEKLVADSRSTVEPKLKALEASIAKRLGMGQPSGDGSSAPAQAPAPAAKPANK
jgi:hypothetical protein